tara:strand:- start:3684 stop:4343 length:660 start_codon:yes stop_codon:yes gene_type:complete
MICRDKTIFIHIPKCGGTSITFQYLDKYGIPVEPQMRFETQTWSQGFATHYIRGWRNKPPYKMYISNMHATYDQYILTHPNSKYITQVRHPYTRFRSAWNHLADIGWVTKSFKDWVPCAIDSMKEGRWTKCIDDKDLLYELHLMKPGFDPSMLTKPQWIWLRPGVEIHRLEDKTIWKALDIQEDKKNVSQSRPYEWTDKNKELIYEYYKKDFEDFNYGA